MPDETSRRRLKQAGKQAGNHVHLFNQPFPSDPRFTRYLCGAVERADRISENPGVRWWGFGPKDATCGECAHLVAFQQSKRWYKCRQRMDLTCSASTDQRLRWEACGRFQARTGDVEDVEDIEEMFKQ